MFGIAGYEPAASGSVDELLSGHGPRLHALTGRRLTSVTGTRYDTGGADDWGSPLILDFGGPRLELDVRGLHQLYVSWNTIDTALPITDPDDDPDAARHWDELTPAEAGGALTAEVAQVRLLEHDFRMRATPDGPVTSRAWILAGLELLLTDGRALQLTNLWQDLTLTTEPPDSPSWRRHPLSS